MKHPRPKVFGVLNLTPDSFSDGGKWMNVPDAIAHSEAMIAVGADYVDVGGESTKPGAERVSADIEQGRVIPIIRELVARGIPTSIDTMRASTAELAVAAGAQVINDVSGGLADPAMPTLAAFTGKTYIAMHWRGESANMYKSATYGNVAMDVASELSERVSELRSAGISPDRLVLDPGIGFAKTPEQNWQLLSKLSRLQQLGYPLMLGVSRKRFLAGLVSADAPPADRDLPTAILSVLAAQKRVWALRVHNVSATVTALQTLEAWQSGSNEDEAAQ